MALAAYARHTAVVEALVSAGANLEQQDKVSHELSLSVCGDYYPGTHVGIIYLWICKLCLEVLWGLIQQWARLPFFVCSKGRLDAAHVYCCDRSYQRR